MFFSYTVSVCLVALGIYGFISVIQDIWEWLQHVYAKDIPEITLLVIVQNREYDIEYIVRYLIEKIDGCVQNEKYDIVVADRNSDDLTLSILERLAEEFEYIRIVNMPLNIRSLTDAVPLCSGGAVYVLDLINRLTIDEFYAAVKKITD